jgi:hypothetical protein
MKPIPTKVLGMERLTISLGDNLAREFAALFPACGASHIYLKQSS